MTSIDPFRSAADLARHIQTRELPAAEVLDTYLARIERHNAALNAVVTLDAERARERAAAADQALARGESWGPLHGVPFTLKDCYATAGVRTTVGAREFEHYVPDRDSSVAARLRAAGGILIGKTNVPPMLTSMQTDNPIFGRTHNPWDLARTPGGSSGGSAAAVAAALTAFDVGSDMSGSIRIPAGFCGVFGFKPTSNRVPSTGHFPPPPGMPRLERIMASYGPLTRSLDDIALITRVLVGPDGQDPEIAPVPWREVQRREPRSLRIAYLPSFPGVPTARDVRDAAQRAADALASAGAQVEERNPGFSIEELNEVWRANLGLLMPLMQELSGMTLPGSSAGQQSASLVEFVRMSARRDALVVAADSLLTQFDAFLSPACIAVASPCGPPRTPIPVDGVPVESRFVDHYFYPWNLTGLPALVLPACRSTDGLPIGVQLVAKRYGDEALLAVASAVCEVIGSDFVRPPAFA